MSRLFFGITAIFLVGLFGCSANSSDPQEQSNTDASASGELATAVFAGGCFWCIEADFEKLEGVSIVQSGYSGGTFENPTYKDVTRDDTGHYEVVEVTYNPSVVSYGKLVDYFLRHVDPLDAGGQFCDRGSSYRTAIFVENEEERAAAEASIAKGEDVIGETFVTPVLDRARFYVAEDYHQDYYLKNPLRYKYYRTSCGRDRRVDSVWGKRSEG